MSVDDARLTEHQEYVRELVQKQLSYANRSVDLIAESISEARVDTLAVVLAMYGRGELELRWLVFHSCDRNQPCEKRLFKTGFKGAHSRCKRCEQMVEDPDDFTYELAASMSAKRSGP